MAASRTTTDNPTRGRWGLVIAAVLVQPSAPVTERQGTDTGTRT
jgi:hypothetical protein